MFSWIKKFSSVSKFQHIIASLEQSLNTLHNDYNQLLGKKDELELALNTLHDDHNLLLGKKEELLGEKGKLSKEKDELKLKNQIISSILNTHNENEGLRKFKDILDNDFLEFTKQENSLEEEAEVFLKLQEIYEELKLIAACPALYKKTIVAVGGGFSSGKSEFISSFFQEGEAKLAIGIEPMTAIPTYVIGDEERELIGCSKNGGVVELSKIDPQIQSKMSHDFIQSFDFNLKDIMPFAVLKTHLEGYNDICFVDTPGYNPSNIAEGYTSQDSTTAKDFLENADVLLWLIGIDSNGTIPKSDLDFLQTLNLSEKKLYIILNKSDLRSVDDLQDILSEIASTLEIEDIEYEGISAYSSRRKKEFAYEKMPLQEFLDSCNHPAKKQEKILLELHEIKSKYRYAILKREKEQEALLGLIKSISLDLYEMEIEDMDHPIHQRLGKLKEFHSSKSKKQELQLLDEVFLGFQERVNYVFGTQVNLDIQDIEKKEIKLKIDTKIKNIIKKDVKKYQDAKVCLEKKDYKKASQLFLESANLGNALACYELGMMYLQGIGGNKDIKKARGMFVSGAEKGDAKSCGELANICIEEEKYDKAKEISEMGISLGDDESYFQMARIYYEGLAGMDQNFSEAKEMLKIAIEKGNVKACNLLGWMYQQGTLATTQDIKKAKRFYEMGIERGNLISYTALAELYRQQENLSKAKELCQKVISLGDDLACYVMGRCFPTIGSDDGVKFFQMGMDRGGVRFNLEEVKSLWVASFFGFGSSSYLSKIDKYAQLRIFGYSQTHAKKLLISTFNN